MPVVGHDHIHPRRTEKINPSVFACAGGPRGHPAGRRRLTGNRPGSRREDVWAAPNAGGGGFRSEVGRVASATIWFRLAGEKRRCLPRKVHGTRRWAARRTRPETVGHLGQVPEQPEPRDVGAARDPGRQRALAAGPLLAVIDATAAAATASGASPRLIAVVTTPTPRALVNTSASPAHRSPGRRSRRHRPSPRPASISAAASWARPPVQREQGPPAHRPDVRHRVLRGDLAPRAGVVDDRVRKSAVATSARGTQPARPPRRHRSRCRPGGPGRWAGSACAGPARTHRG